MTSTSIQAQKGRAVLLKVASNTSPINYQTATGLRSTDVSVNGNPVDITTKSSQGFRELFPGAGIEQVDISGSGIWDSSNPRLAVLQAAALAGGAIIDAQVVFGAGDSFVGEWSVDTFKRTGNHNDAEMFDVTLKSHGLVQYIPAT